MGRGHELAHAFVKEGRNVKLESAPRGIARRRGAEKPAESSKKEKSIGELL